MVCSYQKKEKEEGREIMASAEVKIALDKIHTNNGYNKNIHLHEEDRNYKIRGLQVVTCYLEKWGLIINETCNENEINLNINSNTETKNQAKNIEIINETVKKLSKRYPIYQKDRLFALFLDVYPEFIRQQATPHFENWISNGRIKTDIETLFGISGIDGLFHTDGITEETDKKIEEFISDLIKFL